jgi:integrase
MPGLFKRGNQWHIDKQVGGHRLRESCGTDSLIEAEQYLTRRLEQLRLATVYGVRPKRQFKEAATKYLLENQHKASIVDNANHLKLLCQYIGHLHLEQVHNDALQAFIKARLKQGKKHKTINNALQVVRRILNLAATQWRDDNGNTWLLTPAKIAMLPTMDSREPYPLDVNEQAHLFHFLPKHLRQMALFKVSTGCREQEVCQLQWQWEIPVPELETSVFVIPSYIFKNNQAKRLVKNGENRLVILNKIAMQVIESQRGQHPQYVFTYCGKPLGKMNNSAWRRAREKAQLPFVRIHDLKHTFGRRLRAAGVSFEDRQDLLGHKSGRITTHYSTAELHQLVLAANKVCDQKSQSPALTLLRSCQLAQGKNAIPTISPHRDIVAKLA